MTEPRIPLDHLTSDQLDHLYNKIAQYRRLRAIWEGHTATTATRANKAESTLARVRALAADIRDGTAWTHSTHNIAARITAALGEQPAHHRYLSTGCLHGEHAYCSNVDGIAGVKKPAQCKWCAAPCTCACHTEQPKEQQ